MAIRSQWKGFLKLALVSCPIALYPATSKTERVSFRQINGKTGNRINQQLVDSETKDVVNRDDLVKGYEVGKNEYVLIQDAELEELQIESSRVIEIDYFVPRDEIDPRFVDAPYYIAPSDKVGQDAFAVIREAMRGRDLVGIGRVVLSSRERPIMLEAFDKGIRAMTLRYPYEVRAETAYFEDVPDTKPSKELLDLAATIVDSKLGAFDPEQFIDRYENAVVELIEAKKAGKPPKKPAPAPRNDNVVNLADALRASLKEKPKAKPAKPATKPAAKAKNKRAA